MTLPVGAAAVPGVAVGGVVAAVCRPGKPAAGLGVCAPGWPAVGVVVLVASGVRVALPSAEVVQELCAQGHKHGCWRDGL